jgi:hypothetical protein
MHVRPLDARLVGALSLALLSAACEGSSGSGSVTDGGMADKPGPAREARATSEVAARAGSSPTPTARGTCAPSRPRAARTPPTVAAGAKKAAPGQAQLLGLHRSACSSGAMPKDGSRWCAFSLPGDTLGKFDLWVINVTKAIKGTVNCNPKGARRRSQLHPPHHRPVLRHARDRPRLSHRPPLLRRHAHLLRQCQVARDRPLPGADLRLAAGHGQPVQAAHLRHRRALQRSPHPRRRRVHRQHHARGRRDHPVRRLRRPHQRLAAEAGGSGDARAARQRRQPVALRLQRRREETSPTPPVAPRSPTRRPSTS